MAAADDDESPPASSRECDDFLDLFQALRADIELWPALEGLRPGVVSVGCGCTEGNIGLRSRDFLLYLLHLAHFYNSRVSVLQIVCL